MIVKPFNPDKIKNAKTREEKLGFENEKQTAYILDFEFKNLIRFAIIHDIKINYKGRTAQIDHLVITPTGIYVVESKFSSGTIKIDENNWIIEYNGTDKAFPSPIAQNERHISVLRDLLGSEDIFPSKRFPELKSIIAIASSTIIKGKRPTEVMLAENIPAFIDKERVAVLTSPLKLAKAVFNTYSENIKIETICEKLLAFDVSEQTKPKIIKKENLEQPKTIAKTSTLTEISLMAMLQETRKVLTREHNVSAAYHIFSNAELAEIEKMMPASKEEMLKIHGVGELKFEKYGAAFLKTISDFKAMSEPATTEEKADKNLLYELKVVRTKLAKEHNIQMAHHVFSNETLKEMADKMPGSKEEMLTVYGVGEVKFEKYGAHFLNAIAAFKLSSVGRQ